MAQVHKAEGPRPSHSQQAEENLKLPGRGARKLMNAGQASSLGSAAQDMQDDVQATDGTCMKTVHWVFQYIYATTSHLPMSELIAVHCIAF